MVITGIAGSYYLVDSGYAIGSAFLPPHKSTRYHAQEFRGANWQPSTPQELFNYRHSSLRMVIERCFGVLKARFPVLTGMHSFSISRQRLIVTACCALLAVHCTTLSACITEQMKCSMCGKDHLCITATQTQQELHA